MTLICDVFICDPPKIVIAIQGPIDNPGAVATGFGDGENVNAVSVLPLCTGGTFSYEGASTAWDGFYRFSANYPGYRTTGLADGATCTNTGSGATALGICQGQFAVDLYCVDSEPAEIRQCPNVPLPVNVISGNVWFDQTDTAIPGIGPGLRLVRSYNSSLANLNIVGAFGRGWTHSYESKLTFPKATVIKLRPADGSPIWFEDFNSDSTYNALLPRLETSWIVLSGGVYTRNFRRGGSETYDSTGRLTGQTDPSGNTVTFAYDPAGRLQTVTEPSTRALTFAYDSNGKVVSVSGPSGVIASYAYDAANFLESVAYPDGSGFTFSYDGSGRVLSIVDAGWDPLESTCRHASLSIL